MNARTTRTGSIEAVSEDQSAERVSVSREVRATTGTMLPWALSVLLHAGLVLVAVFVVWTTMTEVQSEAPLAVSIDPTWHESPQLQQETREKIDRNRSSRRVSQVTRPTQSSQMTDRVQTPLPLIGVTDTTSDLATPVGMRIGDDGDGPDFIGQTIGSNVERMVFLIDASGSMIDMLPFVILELQRSIHKLSDKQSFTVIFFQGDRVIEVPPAGMKTADEKTRARVAQWIDPSQQNVHAGGKTHPIAAIQKALKYRPQVVFILSDNITGSGQAEINQQRLLAEIQRANTNNARINTIQFLYPDPLSKVPGRRGTLELIAEQTRGKYKFLDSRELIEGSH